ncbi:MAG: hypothetical protein RLZZ156_1948 [Deinococcota bacterium]|jgi:hypothetical protein
MSKQEDEAALNAAWVILKSHQIPDGLLGVFYLETREQFVLLYEEENCEYQEWVRLDIKSLTNLPQVVLEEAARRLAKRIGITRRRFIDPRKSLKA